MGENLQGRVVTINGKLVSLLLERWCVKSPWNNVAWTTMFNTSTNLIIIRRCWIVLIRFFYRGDMAVWHLTLKRWPGDWNRWKEGSLKCQHFQDSCPPTREIGSLLVLPPRCILISKWSGYISERAIKERSILNWTLCSCCFSWWNQRHFTMREAAPCNCTNFS